MQQTSVLYDGRASATPSQIRAADQRASRLDRLRVLANPDSPLVIDKDASISLVANFPVPDYSVMWFYDLVFGVDQSLERPVAKQHLRKGPPRIDEIQIECAKYYGVTRADILSSRRTACVMRPRQVAYYLAKTLTPKSFPEIGRRFGGRDHTSILSGVRKIERLRLIDCTLEGEIDALSALLGANDA